MPPNDTIPQALGKNIRKFRDQINLTQERLAERASLDPTYISGIERGHRNPGIINVAKIAKALGIKTSLLVEGVEA